MRVMPMIYVCVLIGSLSLMALPYLSGYYSKDMILEVTRGQYRINGRVTNWLGMITATITSLYTIRMIAYTFVNGVNGRERVYGGVIEAKVRKEDLMYEVPLVILAVGSIFLGYITREVFVGIGTTMMSGIYVNPMNKIGIEVEEIGGLEKVLPVVSTVMGGLIYGILRRGRIISLNWVGDYREEEGKERLTSEEKRRRKETLSALNKQSMFIGYYARRWMNMVVVRTGRGYDWWDNIYNGIVISGGSKVSYMMAKNVDKGVVELIGPLGLRRVLGGISRRMMELDSGYILHYGLYIIVGAMLVVSSYLYE